MAVNPVLRDYVRPMLKHVETKEISCNCAKHNAQNTIESSRNIWNIWYLQRNIFCKYPSGGTWTQFYSSWNRFFDIPLVLQVSSLKLEWLRWAWDKQLCCQLVAFLKSRDIWSLDACWQGFVVFLEYRHIDCYFILFYRKILPRLFFIWDLSQNLCHVSLKPSYDQSPPMYSFPRTQLPVVVLLWWRRLRIPKMNP